MIKVKTQKQVIKFEVPVPNRKKNKARVYLNEYSLSKLDVLSFKMGMPLSDVLDAIMKNIEIKVNYVEED